MRFATECYSCGAPGYENMLVVDIPHFKVRCSCGTPMGTCFTVYHYCCQDVIIMCFSCEQCGYRNSEVRAGGAVPPHGTTLELKADPNDNIEEDLRRDVIKSDSAVVAVSRSLSVFDSIATIMCLSARCQSSTWRWLTGPTGACTLPLKDCFSV